MKQFNSIVDKDPLKLKKYDTGSAEKPSKMIYVFLAAVPILLILSLVFWVLGSFTSAFDEGYGPSQSKAPRTQSSNPDDDNYDAEASPMRGDLYTDRSKIADGLAKIQIGLHIMPSQNDEQGIILMHWTNQTNAQESRLGDKVDVGDNYFYYDNTAEYFPVLKFNPDYAPFGNAASFCIHLQWIKKDMRKMYDMYKTVQGFPDCSNAMNPKFRWQSHDPKTGVDFKVWHQELSKVSSEGECNSKGGVFRPAMKGDGGKCYVYNVVKRICLMVAFKEHPETASYTWEYRGGCYGSGDIAVYEKAVPGEEYKFEHVPIEVREDESLYVAFDNVEVEVTSTLSPIFMLLSTLSLILSIVSGILVIYFFFKAWKGVQPGDRMRHQQQIDEQ